jgi:hypothetical protein
MLPMVPRFVLPLFGVVVLLAGCSSPPPPPEAIATPLLAGMSQDELLQFFGPPIRRERLSDGREDWIYHFGSQTQESKTSSDSKNIPFGHTYSYSHTSTTTTTMSEQPIHLSAAGQVVGPIPVGQLIRPR